jgi:hypothetical protein
MRIWTNRTVRWDSSCLPADLGSGLGSRVDAELRKNPLGVMPGSMSADLQGFGDDGIRAPLGQQDGHFQLPGGKSILKLKVRISSVLTFIPDRANACPAVLLKLVSELAHDVERASYLIDKGLAVLPEDGEGVENVSETIE